VNIFITGIAGLIGSRLAKWIVDNVKNARIFGIDDLSGGYVENIPSDADFYPIHLGNGSDNVKYLFSTHPPDYVFHIAAFAAEGLSPFVRQYTIQNTWMATAEIINNCIECGNLKRLVFTSSMATYGRQRPPFSEDMPLQPIDPYGVGKAACEQDIRIAGEQHGLPWTIIRPHNVYGPGQNIWGDYRNVLGIWMRQSLEEKPIRVYGDGSQTRAFSHINDCLECLWNAAISPETDKEVINLGGTRPITIADAAREVASITGNTHIEHTKPRHEVKEAWATWKKSVDLLGYKDRTPLRNGLKQMWTWAQKSWQQYPNRRNPQPLEYEIKTGLYDWWAKSKSGSRTLIEN